MGIKKRILSFYNVAIERIKQLTGKKRLVKLSSLLTLRRIIEIAYMITLLILFAGIINALLELGTVRQYFSDLSIIRSSRIQSFMDTFLNFLLVSVGTLGIYLMYLGGRKIGTKVPSLYVILGLTVLIMSTLIFWFILSYKGV
ncbi:MAG: hypothetical protein ACPLY9_02185 [Nitrososphaerales archaeon]